MTTTLQDTTSRDTANLKAAAGKLRRDSLISTTAAGSGHPTSCLSCADLLATLFYRYLRSDLTDPDNPANDRFVLSKGHAAPILWAALAEAGAVPEEELRNLREFDSELEGHPTPRSRFVDVATGSLGQGLSAGVGMARASQIDGLHNRIYVLLGDGETAEGAVWEAAALAAHYELSSLTAIIDVNRLGQSEPTMYGHDTRGYADRFKAFGWHVETIDGHDLGAIQQAYENAIQERKRPTAIIAETIKGKGVSFLEDKEGKHGKAVSEEELSKALAEIGEPEMCEPLRVAPPAFQTKKREAAPHASIKAPAYDSEAATRDAYGKALVKVGHSHPEVVALDGEVKDSTRAARFEEAFPDRFTQCYIAEQNMAGMALGMSAVGKVPFVSSFASFLSRAADQIRMAGISRSNIKFCGSHAGVSIGQDGPSQMGLEDLAIFRSVPGSIVLHPADAVCMERAVEAAIRSDSIFYLRAMRPKLPILYAAEDTFEVGRGIVLRRTADDRATIAACGITVHEALAAANQLAEEGIPVRVIDCWSVKPIDRSLLEQAVEETGALVTVEDHYPEGGLGDAVATALSGKRYRSRHLAVRDIPRSGAPDALLASAGIDRMAIVSAVRDLVR